MEKVLRTRRTASAAGAIEQGPARAVGMNAPFPLVSRGLAALSLEALSPRVLHASARRRARELVLGDGEVSLRAAFKREILRPMHVQFGHKVAFSCSVMLLLLVQAVMLRAPSFFWLLYVALAIPLLLWRVHDFFARRLRE
jgi:hypothetical protein